MPNDFVMVGTAGFKPAHIRQGGVGDCWFLAALAVVAERGAHLLSRNVLTTATNPHGHYLFRLFIDGNWRLYSVDDHLPVRKGRTKASALRPCATYHEGGRAVERVCGCGRVAQVHCTECVHRRGSVTLENSVFGSVANVARAGEERGSCGGILVLK